MKTVIAGSRWIEDREVLDQVMDSLDFKVSEVVSGTARGVDKMGEQWAADNGLPVKRFPANWKSHGKGAGPIRNDLMARYAEAAVILWDGESKGTKHMISVAQAQGLNLTVVRVRPAVSRQAHATA